MLYLTDSSERRKSRFVYLGYEIINEEQIKPKKQKIGNGLTALKSVSNVKSDNSICYCFNCKKVLKMNIHENKIKKQNVIKKRIKKESFSLFYNNNQIDNNETENMFEAYDFIQEVYTCPECGHTEIYDDMYFLRNDYYQYCNYYLNGNKIAISLKFINFNYYNNNLVCKETKRRIILNLDTGYSYLLPDIINGKKKGSIKNITYSSMMDTMNHRYSNKCNNINDVYVNIFNEIRKYKMNKFNIYLPTLKEYTKSKYKYKCYANQQDIFLFNRFPTMDRILAENLRYSLDRDKKYNVVNFRRLIKQDDKDPVNTILKHYNIPSTKTNKKLFKENVRFIHLFKILCKYINKYDNIMKILNSKPNTLYYYDYLEEDYLFFIDFALKNGINENSLCNKLVKNNIYTICDIGRNIKLIKSLKPDYKFNLKMDYQELHDILSKEYNKLTHENHELIYSEEELKLEGQYGDLNFKFAKDTYELIDVGTYMNICVGSYGTSAISKRCNIMVAKNDKDEPIICIELDPNCFKIRQTKLKFNHNMRENYENMYEFKAIKEWINNNTFYIETYDLPDNFKTMNNNKNNVIEYKKVLEKEIS